MIAHYIITNCVIICRLILIFVWYLPGSNNTWVVCYTVWRKFAICSHQIWCMLVLYHFYDIHCKIIRYFIWCRSMLFGAGLLYSYWETQQNILFYCSVTCAGVSVTCSLWWVSKVRNPFVYRYTILQYMNILNGWVYVYWKL
jgi:hypothetical protein